MLQNTKNTAKKGRGYKRKKSFLPIFLELSKTSFFSLILLIFDGNNNKTKLTTGIKMYLKENPESFKRCKKIGRKIKNKNECIKIIILNNIL